MFEKYASLPFPLEEGILANVMWGGHEKVMRKGGKIERKMMKEVRGN
jgi:hypothetical protein